MASSARRCAKGSSTAVRMCAASSTTTSSETLRCRPSTTKRGVRAPGRQRSVPVMPRSTVVESRTSVIAPVPRLRYHRGLGPAAARIMRVAGQAPTVTTAPVRVDEPRGQAERLEPARRGRSAHDRRGARRVGVHARGRGDGDGAPHRRRRLAGARVDDVMDVAPGAAPAAHRRCSTSPGRRRARPRAGRRRRGRRGGRRSRARASRPAGPGPAVATSPPRLTSVGDPVAAAMAVAARSAASALAVAPRSRRQPGREAQEPAAARRARRSASRPRATPVTSSGASAAHRGEVVVVAQGDERRRDGRVDEAAGLLGGAQRGAHGVREQPADAPSRARRPRWPASARSRRGSGCTRGRWRRARPRSRRLACSAHGSSTTTTAVVPMACSVVVENALLMSRRR